MAILSMGFSPPKVLWNGRKALATAQSSPPQPVQAQGVKSWKMHVHEKSVWEVFGDEARWMARMAGGGFGTKGDQ